MAGKSACCAVGEICWFDKSGNGVIAAGTASISAQSSVEIGCGVRICDFLGIDDGWLLQLKFGRNRFYISGKQNDICTHNVVMLWLGTENICTVIK